MSLARTIRFALGLGVLLGSWSCSGGGGGGGGKLSIQSCSLGCSSSGSGVQFSCPITEVFVNQEIRVTFSSPVDLTSVDTNTFRVKQQGIGKTPAGRYDLDPADPRVVIYRPLVTFNSSGAPIFGFEDGAAYILTIPGTQTDPNETRYVRSKSGAANSTRMSCTVVASRGVFDIQPGQPEVKTAVDIVDDGDIVENQDPEEDFLPEDPVVSQSTDITIVFDDIMNPASLVNPVTHESNSITVRIDVDGDISDSSDQVEIPGQFEIAIDQIRLTTTVTFQPDGDLPSSGSDPVFMRRVVIDLPGTIEDLGGNPILDPRRVVFTPERILFDALPLVESFDAVFRQDQPRSGTGWTTTGELVPAIAGGSGRLGDLVVPAGSTVTLSTDPGEDFSDITDDTIFNPANVLEPTVFGEVDPILDGVFEFSRLRIDSGGTLRFTGALPPRVYVRGECVVQGILDVSGRSATPHDSDQECGGLGGDPGPGGGIGGDGGVRPDGTGFEAEGGEPNDDPCAVPVVLYEDVNGKPGGGIPAPNTLDPNPTLVAGGSGGLAWPQPDPTLPNGHFPEDITDTDGMQFEQRFGCQSRIPGGAGAGGGHRFPGKDGHALLVPVSSVDPATPPPDSEGGDNSLLDIDPTLDPENGFLSGGGGGGGGGSHLQETKVNGLVLNDCTMPATGTTLVVQSYRHHSSAGGGGGGGGIQIQGGRRVQIDGVLDASGGDGGSTLTGDRAQAGGGGAGGSVLLQAPTVVIQPVANRIDVSGGLGGVGVNLSPGGLASPGLVRLEAIDQDPFDVESESPKVAPTEAEVVAEFGGMIEDILSVGPWLPPTQGGPLATLGADNLSGIQSCWFRPQGNFFELEFSEDGGFSELPENLGWDLALRLAGITDVQSYRESMNDRFPAGTSIEEGFGNGFENAPLVVRFQGARALGAVPDPCNVTLAGIASEIFPGSLTGWVEHPSELNDFFENGENPVLRPNMMRFTIIWDVSNPFYEEIEAIEEIQVFVRPD